MNSIKFINRKNWGISVVILNALFFLLILIMPTGIVRSIVGGTWMVIAFGGLFLLVKKEFYPTEFEDQQVVSPSKQTFYQQQANILNQFLTLKDIEVHNLETELSIKDTLYKQFFDSSPDAFIIYNEHSISYYNDAFTKLVGLEADDMPSSSLNIWQFIHPKSMAKARAAYHELFTNPIAGKSVDLEILTLDNTIKEVKISSSISFFQDTSYVFSNIHDLSDHNEQERIRAKLKNDVANEKFKVEYFGNISHDIKTPINVIYSAVQLQEMYADAKDYDQILVYNSVIRQNCLRLQKLLNNVLDITKIDADHFKPNLERCNIIYHIEHITQSVTSYTEHNNISIIFDTNVEDKFVTTDLSFIERIMLNLISNAIKYGKRDGHVWVTLHDTGDHLIISVKDDGIGIPKEETDKIFKRFHKTNQSGANGVSSNGIGLSLVKSMVTTLEGDIFCLSTEGVGSEFVVILPMISLSDYRQTHSEYAASLELSTKINIELSDF